MANEDQLQRKRRNRTEWRRIVASWRRSGMTGADFADARGIAEGSLRWWAWRLARDGESESSATGAQALVPVRVIEETPESERDDVGDAHARVEWTLRTSRGEIRVFSADVADELRAAVIVLIGDGA